MTDDDHEFVPGDVIAHHWGGFIQYLTVVGYSSHGKLRMLSGLTGTERATWWSRPSGLPSGHWVHHRAETPSLSSKD